MNPLIVSGHAPSERVRTTSHRLSKLYIDGVGWNSIHAASGQRVSWKRRSPARRTVSLRGSKRTKKEKNSTADRRMRAARSGFSAFASMKSTIGRLGGAEPEPRSLSATGDPTGLQC